MPDFWLAIFSWKNSGILSWKKIFPGKFKHFWQKIGVGLVTRHRQKFSKFFLKLLKECIKSTQLNQKINDKSDCFIIWIHLVSMPDVLCTIVHTSTINQIQKSDQRDSNSSAHKNIWKRNKYTTQILMLNIRNLASLH